MTGTAYGAGYGLNLRDREILKDIIHTFVASGEPVSSRAVSKHSQHNLSAASIRNSMADLEDLGLLHQPHTSAGRVPTEAAYRLYVDSLMDPERIPVRQRRYIDHELDVADAAGSLVTIASRLLSELSSQVGVVLTPGVDESLLRSADFVPLGHRRVLCVLVSGSGFVDNVVIQTDREIPRTDLVRFSNYVTENFAGTTLRSIRDRLMGSMGEQRRDIDDYLRRAMDFAQQAFQEHSAPREVVVKGTNALLGQPELADIDRVRLVLDTFADKARLANLLSLCLESGEGVRVFLGQDSEVTSELDFSLVATPYGTGSAALGSLGVIGPSRMEYPRVVPLVRYLGQTLSRALAREPAAT